MVSVTVSSNCKRAVCAAVAASTVLMACGGDPDAAEPASATRETLATPGFHPVAPCFSESDYVSRAVVRFFDGHYTPRCLRLASGGTVVFQGNFSIHPLAPRPIESMPSPILPTNSGGSVEFEFTEHGFYPYQDTAHPEEIGVVWSNYY